MPELKKTTVFMEPDVWKLLKKEAEEKGKALSILVREILRKHLGMKT